MVRGMVRMMPSLKSRCPSSLVNHFPDDKHEVNDVEGHGQNDAHVKVTLSVDSFKPLT